MAMEWEKYDPFKARWSSKLLLPSSLFESAAVRPDQCEIYQYGIMIWLKIFKSSEKGDLTENLYFEIAAPVELYSYSEAA